MLMYERVCTLNSLDRQVLCACTLNSLDRQVLCVCTLNSLDRQVCALYKGFNYYHLLFIQMSVKRYPSTFRSLLLCLNV